MRIRTRFHLDLVHLVALLVPSLLVLPVVLGCLVSLGFQPVLSVHSLQVVPVVLVLLPVLESRLVQGSLVDLAVHCLLGFQLDQGYLCRKR